MIAQESVNTLEPSSNHKARKNGAKAIQLTDSELYAIARAFVGLDFDPTLISPEIITLLSAPIDRKLVIKIIGPDNLGKVFNIDPNAPQPQPKDESEDSEDGTLVGDLGETDLGDARLFIEWYGDKVRYVPTSNQSLFWDGTRWKIDDSLDINRLVQTMPTRLMDEAAKCTNPKEQREKAQHAINCASMRKMKAIWEVAKTQREVVTQPGDLDSDPWRLNVQNGTIDLRTGELHPHNPKDLITKLIAIEYDPGAQCPLWDRFLDKILAGDGELISYLKRAIGYSLTASTIEQCLFFLWGNGNNGKSVLIETVLRLLGPYATTMPTESLMKTDRSGGAATPDLVRLMGRRFVSANETRKGQRLDEPKIKQLSDGSTIPMRELYGKQFEYKLQHKLWIAGNYKPTITGVDDGIWRRMNVIAFKVQIKPEEIDPLLAEKLWREKSGILRWMVDGCIEWQKNRLGKPAAIQQATAEYRAESDNLRVFIEDYLIVDAASKVSTAEVYSKYSAWAEKGGDRPMSAKSLGIELKHRGFEQGKSGSNRYWRGFRFVENI